MKEILLTEKRDGIPCVITFPCFQTSFKKTLPMLVFTSAL